MAPEQPYTVRNAHSLRGRNLYPDSLVVPIASQCVAAIFSGR